MRTPVYKGGAKKKKKHSITMQIFAVVALILTVTVLCLWCMNNFFLTEFYYSKKKEIFAQAYQAISKDLDLPEENMQDTLMKLRYEQNISFIRTMPNWEMTSVSENCISKMEKGILISHLKKNLLLQDSNRTQILTRTDSYTIQEAFYAEMSAEYMECYGTFDDGTAFLMSVPLEAVRESASISNQFLIVTGVIVMVLSALVLTVITRNLTRPILELADLSEKIANLDFSVRYMGREKNEIGILGTSMNRLSDELEGKISELKEANSQLKKDIEEKIQIDEVRKEFLSNVSHELKTPIALIQGYAEGLVEGVSDDPESRQFYCEVIMDEANKMAKMVKKLLTLNHLEFGQDAMSQEEFDITELLDSKLNASAMLFEQKQITVKNEYERPCLVLADEFKIEEVCTNYISNALNHCTEQGCITIRVTREDGRARISVENTGDPIPEEDLEKVWTKFFKVDKARTREYGGSGIGLSIVKAIMEAHHQSYGVRNTNQGVEFWFELELQK